MFFIRIIRVSDNPEQNVNRMEKKQTQLTDKHMNIYTHTRAHTQDKHSSTPVNIIRLRVI